MLFRMMDSLGLIDNNSNGSQGSSKNSRIGCSSIYANPNTLLSSLSNSNQELETLRVVSHEHTDSGLGGDQDCAYSSGR